MGIFNLFKKKEQLSDKQEKGVLLAMPMYNNGETFDIQKVVDYLKNNWNSEVTDIDDKFMTVDGEMVALMEIPAQIPWDDIQGTAHYAYNWATAEKDLENHNSHTIVTILSNNKSQVERFTILTKVLASILATSNAIGVYQGSQSLLIPREQYLESAEAIKTGKTPINLWVYIGLRKSDMGNNAYSYGLVSFGKLEMEFINCNLEFEEMYDFLDNICAYVINSNVTFKNGETLGYTAEQKIKINKSKGLFVEGESLKLEI